MKKTSRINIFNIYYNFLFRTLSTGKFLVTQSYIGFYGFFYFMNDYYKWKCFICLCYSFHTIKNLVINKINKNHSVLAWAE